MFPDRVVELAGSLEYNLTQVNGCRYFGPRRDLVHFTPPEGSEVFVGKLPPDCYEDEIFHFFRQVGFVYRIRLMVTFTNDTRGYAFVMFLNEKMAEHAVIYLNGMNIRANKPLFVTRSTDHRNLVISGLPPSVTSQEVKLVSTLL